VLCTVQWDTTACNDFTEPTGKPAGTLTRRLMEVGSALRSGCQDLCHTRTAAQHRLALDDHDDHSDGCKQIVLPGLRLGPDRQVHLVVKEHDDQNAAPSLIEHWSDEHAQGEDANYIGPERPGGVPPRTNAGKCHTPQIVPRMSEAQSGANQRCSSGSATPRQPNSSPSGPMNKVIANAGSTVYQGVN
jgi:hypothetical protein